MTGTTHKLVTSGWFLRGLSSFVLTRMNTSCSFTNQRALRMLNCVKAPIVCLFNIKNEKKNRLIFLAVSCSSLGGETHWEDVFTWLGQISICDLSHQVRHSAAFCVIWFLHIFRFLVQLAQFLYQVYYWIMSGP